LKNFDTRTYSISDFAEWQDSGLLRLSPEFQRRAVWTTKAKSYLVDTILRGKPMPKVLITQRLIDGRNVRTVVDGQQRLRAILEYLGDDFAVMRTHNQEFAGRRYSELPDSIRSDFWQYEIGVDVLFDTELSELLDIFARLNTYSVKLNSTELLNATYLGAFKTTAHELGHNYAGYLLESRVLTNAQVARMGEVELSADLLGALLDGISSRKAIPSFYKNYDDAEEDVERAAVAFRETMSFFGEVFDPASLSVSNFRRVHFFYSAFLSISNLLTGRPSIPEIAAPADLPKASRIRIALDNISAQFDEFTQASESAPQPPADFRKFIEGSRRATTDQSVREERSQFISRRIIEN
jgi:hypothetical protein